RGGERKVKREVPTPDGKVARQAPQGKADHDQQTDAGDGKADQDQSLTHKNSLKTTPRRIQTQTEATDFRFKKPCRRVYSCSISVTSVLALSEQIDARKEISNFE